MSKKKPAYNAKELFLRGLMAFGRSMGLLANPMDATEEQVHNSKLYDQRRRKSHAKFKAQCAARREQRMLDK